MESRPQVARRPIDDLACREMRGRPWGPPLWGPPTWGPPSGGPATSNNEFERSVNGEVAGSNEGAGALDERLCSGGCRDTERQDQRDEQRGDGAARQRPVPNRYTISTPNNCAPGWLYPAENRSLNGAASSTSAAICVRVRNRNYRGVRPLSAGRDVAPVCPGATGIPWSLSSMTNPPPGGTVGSPCELLGLSTNGGPSIRFWIAVSGTRAAPKPSKAPS